ncbi:MAG: hypothetical protein L0Z50_40225 [Verrucomicrobiales bacterium]|nr:hypothetical protein [Verrucomicrobiales bacterium]
MNLNIKTAVTITALLIIVPCALLRADLMLMKIHSPKQCPDGLSIKSEVNNGMIEFNVDMDAEKIAHADELYKGRVKANAFLRIATAGQEIAWVNLHGATEGNRTRYHFRISASAAKSSELQLGVHLYEKDGRPTFGGGVSMQIALAGFEPKVEAKMK